MLFVGLQDDKMQKTWYWDPEQSLQGPPTKNVSASASNSAHEIRYDSIIAKPGIPNGQSNGVQAHMEFVTFAPEQAYPEYILRFIEE